MGKYRKGIGITLLILGIAPVILLSIPSTGSYYEFVPSTTMPGVTDIVTVEYTYIPLWGVITHPTFTFSDGLFLAAYIGTIILAIWLIWGRKKVSRGKG